MLLNKDSKNKLKSGFTLLELLLAMGILSILMTLIMRVFIDIIELKLDAEAESAISQDSRYIYSRMTYDINRVSAISQPASPGANSNTLEMTVGGATYTYSIDGSGKLILNDGTQSMQLTSAGSKVTSMSFTRRGAATGAQSLTMNIDLESTTQTVRGAIKRSIKSTVSTR